MDNQLTWEEQKIVDRAKEVVIKYNKQRMDKGELATIYAFVMSESGEIYDGPVWNLPSRPAYAQSGSL